MKWTIHKPQPVLQGRIQLAGSKSISNRALVIRALSGKDFALHRLANARDTVLLQELLQAPREVYDAEAAGTTFRFLSAYLSRQPGTQVLTGTERMKQRPIAILVDALRQLGADIDYLEQEGFPPLRIGSPKTADPNFRLEVSAEISSQYISALLMLAPTLPRGLELQLRGTVVSRPYIEMTLRLMAYFGIEHQWEGQRIWVAPQPYQPRPLTVEADWSAASYYYALSAIAQKTDLELEGLFAESVQGDAVLPEMMQSFGLSTTFRKNGIRLQKAPGKQADSPFEWDFLECPDLAQTLAVACAALGRTARFNGLETLRIKETDRIAALQQELKKVGVAFQEGTGGWFHLQGKASLDQAPAFATYEDHRMAMALAAFSLLGPVQIEDPMVVQKSYPDFWEDLQSLGVEVKRS